MLAFYRDAAAHELCQVLGDRHAQTRAHIRAARVVAFLGKKVKHVLQELRTHANARVADLPAVGNVAVIVFGNVDLCKDLAVGTVVFDAVAVHVEQDLAQVQLAAVHVAVLDYLLVGLVDHGDLGLDSASFHDVVDLLRHMHDVKRLMVDLERAVFELARLEHVVDQRQQMLCRDLYLVAVSCGKLSVFWMRFGDLYEPQDAVERRAHIMAHAMQEPCFDGVGAIGLGLCGKQRALAF